MTGIPGKFKHDLVAKAVTDLIMGLGHDPLREGLSATPDRVARSWEERLSGYSQDPNSILSPVFTESNGYDEMVILTDIPVESVCEHHLLPWSGTASVGYLPNELGHVVGLSKLVRIVDCFARRLQLQERLTKQIATSIHAVLRARGVGVTVRASHGCISCRGVRSPSVRAITSAMFGAFRDDHAVRSEFLSLSAHKLT